jgi:hypothetical protein
MVVGVGVELETVPPQAVANKAKKQSRLTSPVRLKMAGRVEGDSLNIGCP